MEVALKSTIATLLALGLLAGCAETQQGGMTHMRSATGVSTGAVAGKTALQSIAAAQPGDLAPVYGPLAGPSAKRNAAGEVELFLSTSPNETRATIDKAGSVICQSMQLQLVGADDLPSPDKTRKIRYRCK